MRFLVVKTALFVSRGHACNAFVLAALTLSAACQTGIDYATTRQGVLCDQGPPEEISFSGQLRSKMFIDRIPTDKCNPNGVLEPIPGATNVNDLRYAEYMSFCKLTDLSYEEHPATGTDNPAEARILAIVAINWTCRQHQAVPSSGMLIRSSEIGGAEPARPAGLVHGVADVTMTRDTIAQNGEFAYVTSGRPNAVVEPLLTMFRPRQNTHIWHRVTGKITCATDAQGMISSTLEAKIADATKFPSHRVYEYRRDASGTPIFQRILADVPQQALSNLWYLPPVGAP
jgi:hypothetical protein